MYIFLRNTVSTVIGSRYYYRPCTGEVSDDGIVSDHKLEFFQKRVGGVGASSGKGVQVNSGPQAALRLALTVPQAMIKTYRVLKRSASLDTSSQVKSLVTASMSGIKHLSVYHLIYYAGCPRDERHASARCDRLQVAAILIELDYCPPSSLLSTMSSSNLQSIRDALDNYAEKMKIDIDNNPFAEQVQGCDTPGAVLQLLEKNRDEFKEYRDKNRKFIDCLSPVVRFVHAFSGILGEAASLVSRQRSFTFSFILLFIHRFRSNLQS